MSDWRDVSSSNIAAIRPRDGGLDVRFRSGGEYHYPDVSEAMVSEMLSADSVGGYFHRNIRGRKAQPLAQPEPALPPDYDPVTRPLWPEWLRAAEEKAQ